jgi:hypothetical protein
MSRKRNPVPSYLHHGSSNRARAVWTDLNGIRRFRLLPGPFNSVASLQAFAKLQFELGAAPHRVGPAAVRISVNGILLAYLNYAEQHYQRDDGRTSAEVNHIRLVMRHARELHGMTPAAEFGPVALKTVRQRFIAVD